MVVLLQSANGQKNNLIIDNLPNIVWIAHCVHWGPCIGMHDNGLRPMFFQGIATSP